jgi:SAM-dependent methyltransferase
MLIKLNPSVEQNLSRQADISTEEAMNQKSKISPKHPRKNNRSEHWERIWRDSSPSWGSYYHRWLQRVYGFVIPKGARVLELGCGSGDLLASLQPGYGFGIDFAPSA